MSYTFTLTGNSSELSADISPPISLEDGEYVLALINFETYYSFFNINQHCNTFYYGDKSLVLPNGAYEINDIVSYIQEKLPDLSLLIDASNKTSKIRLLCSEDLNFTKPRNLGSLLGFSQTVKANTSTVSDSLVNILTINSICIECNITTGSYRNDTKSHILHQFFPQVPPGYKLTEAPSNLIYLPINAGSILSQLSVRVTDQEGKLIDFNKETITVRLHLKKKIW